MSKKKSQLFAYVKNIYYLCSRKGCKTLNMSAEGQNIIPIIQQYFSTKPVQRAYLFGSYSRGEERVDSDIDLMVDMLPDSKMGLAFYGMMVDLEDILHRPVEIVRSGCLLPFAQKKAEKEKILIYERA